MSFARADRPAGFPAGDIESLCGTGHRDGALTHARERRHRCVGEAVEDQVLVDLVAQHDQVAFAREFGDRSKFVIGEYGAGGVVRDC